MYYSYVKSRCPNLITNSQRHTQLCRASAHSLFNNHDRKALVVFSFEPSTYRLTRRNQDRTTPTFNRCITYTTASHFSFELFSFELFSFAIAINNPTTIQYKPWPTMKSKWETNSKPHPTLTAPPPAAPSPMSSAPSSSGVCGFP